MYKRMTKPHKRGEYAAECERIERLQRWRQHDIEIMQLVDDQRAIRNHLEKRRRFL